MSWILLVIFGYGLIAYVLMRDIKRGLVIHKANFSHLKYGFLPRFTVRERNGRFKANKVGIFYVATH